MTWATPWAAAVAVLAVLPLVAHLWSRHRPAPLPFPTLRFLRSASPVSRRLRRVHDWPLLLLRLAIVATICAAAAGPTLVASWRAQAWRARLHRVVVLDASASERATDVLEHARVGSASISTYGPADLGDLLDGAIADATTRARRTRTEILIAWDGSRAALEPGDLADVPATVGIAVLPRPAGPPASTEPADRPAVVIRAQPADEDIRQHVSQQLGRVTKPSVTTSIEIAWPGAEAPAATGRRAPQHLRRVIDEIAADPRLRDAADRSVRDQRAPAPSTRVAGRTLARANDGAPLLRGWLDQDRLVLVLDATPSSPLAWWSAVVAWEAMARPWRPVSADTWSESDIAAVRRDAVAPSDGTLPGGLDTAAAWAIALILLAVEQWMRRARAADTGSELVDAA